MGRASGVVTWRGRLAVLTAALLPAVRALYEDEVGQYEWILQQIGKPTALAYSAEASDRIFVASASGVVASVGLKDGTVQWRRVASPQAATGGSMRVLRAGGRNLLSLTEGGMVQAWKGSTGDLAWQREYTDGVVDLLIAGQGQKQSAVIVRGSEVELRTMAGKHEWSVAASSIGLKARFWAAALSQDESAVCLVAATADGAGAEVVQVDAGTGKVLKKADLPPAVASGLGKGAFMVADAHIVVLTGDSLHAYPICGEGAGASGGSLELSKVKSKGGGKFRLQPWQRTPGVFSATTGASTAIFGLSPKGLKHLRSFEGVAVVGPVFSVHDDETGQPVAVALVKKEGTQVQLMDPASGNVQPAINAPGYAVDGHGNAELLLVHELSSGEHRTVISAADHSLAGIQGTEVQWVREESLASIKQAVFYARSAAASLAERAARPSEARGLGVLEQLATIPARLAELVEKPMELAAMVTKWVTPKRSRNRKSMNLMPNARVPTSSEELRNFGADKLIIAVTRSSKLFAIEATTSEIVWQRYLGTDMTCLGEKADQQACKPWLRLLPSTSAVNVELLVVAPPVNGKGQRVMWIEPLTGEVMQEETIALGTSVSSVLPLPRKDASHATAYPFLLIDSAHNVHTMPSTSTEAANIVDEHADRFFHYEVDKVAHAVQGFAVKGTGAGAKHELLSLWNLELGSVGEKVVAATSPKHREWDHVPVHIKADASILYKYINRNMLVVVSEEGSGNSTSLNLYALDAVTGHVLHQSHIPGGAAPVNLVACDNWIIMHYHNPRRTRFEISVVEFFQAKADDGPWDIIFGGRQLNNQTKSAHHLETPVPLQQTYIFPAGVTSMGVTATLKGITPRSVIMALTTDHIFRVSKDMLNPRRPYPVTGLGEKDKMGSVPAQFAATKEEALPPYQPLLPLRPTDVLTYYNSMGQVAGIISSPSALESTSLVFCYGLDLFFMPVQTAKAYDVLSPGFNYLLLYASVGSVVALYVITSFIASHKALQDRWK